MGAVFVEFDKGPLPGAGRLWQGVPRTGSGAYTQVREHLDARDNAAIEPQMGF